MCTFLIVFVAAAAIVGNKVTTKITKKTNCIDVDSFALSHIQDSLNELAHGNVKTVFFYEYTTHIIVTR